MTAGPSDKRLYNLQVLRAVAALLVVYYHFSISRHIELRPFFGGFGVDLFFVISGFIIAYSAGSSAADFFVRRLIRIAPIYWVCTLFWAAVVLAAPQLTNESVSLPRLIRSLFFIPDDPVLTRGWTLNYEMYFYLMFAVGMFLSRKWAPAICAALIIVVTASVALAEPESNRLAFYGKVIVLEFLLGSAAFYIWRHTATSPQIVSSIQRWRWPLFGWSVALLVWCAVAQAISLPHKHFLIGLPCFLIILLMILIESYGGISVRNRVIKELGDASYSMYLVHPFVLLPLQRFVYPDSAGLSVSQKIGLFLCAALLVCVVSVLVYRLVERPLTRFLTRAYRGSNNVAFAQ